MKKRTVKDIAEIIHGKVVGKGEAYELSGLASFEEAGPNDITFASDMKFLRKLEETGAGAVIVPADYSVKQEKQCVPILIQTQHPKRDFFRLLSLFYKSPPPAKCISSSSIIGPNLSCGLNVTIGAHVYIGEDVFLGNGVHIMPGCFIGDHVSIGEKSEIKPNVTIMEHTRIGKRVIIHSGTVIGSDGYGYTHGRQGHEKMNHAGFVEIDDDVEIGACNTIDRGTLGRTWIGRGVKTDNLVHIAHNVKVGENTLIVAQAGIAGSTFIGKNVILAGKSGISGHLKIGDGAIVGPGAGVLGNVAPGTVVSGIPEMPHKLWLKVGKIIPRLPDLRKKLRSMERKIAYLEKILKRPE